MSRCTGWRKRPESATRRAIRLARNAAARPWWSTPMTWSPCATPGSRPSRAAIKRVKHRLAVEVRALRGANAAAVLATINPIVRGWANYYRGAASSRIFAALDHYLWQLTYKWACHSHQTDVPHF